MGVVFKLSRADNSVVGGPIWQKFKLLLDIMHVLDTYKFKMDQINSNREKVATSIAYKLRAANSEICDKKLPNFELTQALIYVIVTCKYDTDPIKNS